MTARIESLILRQPTAADVPALADLGRHSFVVKFGHLYTSDNLDPFLEEVFSQDAIAAELADPERRYCIAELGGTLAGYCKVGLGSSYAEHSSGSHFGELKQLYTAPDMTGRGIGAALMDWALEELKALGVQTVLLTVYSENYGAQRFYERYGFAKIADIDFWVGSHRDDEFLLEGRLG